jgi:hypothetical protein
MSGRRITRASEDETMSDDHRQLAVQMLAQPFGQLRYGGGDVRDFLHRVRSIDQLHVAAALCSEVRLEADALELTPERELQLVVRQDLEQFEFDARAAGIEAEYCVAHARLAAWTRCSVRW